MEQVTSLKSITYILSGSLLYTYNGIAGGWMSGLAAIFGFVLFIIGLNRIKTGLDSSGKSGVSLMSVGAIIGGISSLLDLVPMIGILSGIGFIIAFLLLLLGLIRLNNSDAIGLIGQNGIVRLITAMVIAILGAFISLIPIFGNALASIFALIAMFLMVSGWLKVQEGITGQYAVT